jgi:hypothetical protein
MKRHESRNISRSRNRVEALSPCLSYSVNGGKNPFDYLFAKFESQFGKDSVEEKHFRHQLKMKADQKSAKARQNRKRNKV